MKIIKVIICISVLVLFLSNPAQARDKKESPTISDDTTDDTILVLKTGKKLTPGIYVYDAHGTYIGLLVTYGAGFGWLAVYVLNAEAIVQVSLFTGELYGAPLYYESNDCSGNPFLSAKAVNAIIQNHGKYYTGNNTKPVLRTIGSCLKHDGDCESGTLNYPTAPAVEVPPETLGFTTPVALPLTFNAEIKPVGK